LFARNDKGGLEKKSTKFRNLILIFSLLGFLLVAAGAGAIGDRLLGYKFLDKYFPSKNGERRFASPIEERKIVYEESTIIDVVEKASPSVVTVGVKKTQKIIDPFEDLFDPFGFFSLPRGSESQEQEIEQNIGTGFVISKDGLVVTNKHVVADPGGEYKVITSDGKELEVSKIYRDPELDMAILKVDDGLKPLEMGDSDSLKVGQMVIAIGTPLGEFSNTVTKGIISGLGRGIVAGDVFGGMSEQLENVIQTDAAINPGNSGGPLLNSAGQVIGVCVATAGGADNISFAIPINVVKEAVENFNKTGKFERAFLGVKYKMVSKNLSILNEIPEGAYIVEIVEGSPADKAGIEEGDIVIKIDGNAVKEASGGLSTFIQQKKVGEKIEVELWRDDKVEKKTVVLEDFNK